MDSSKFAVQARHFFDFGEMEVTGAYKTSRSFRDAPTNFFNWRVKPYNWAGNWSKYWGTLSQSKEGGYGNLETTQESQILVITSYSIHYTKLYDQSVLQSKTSFPPG